MYAVMTCRILFWTFILSPFTVYGSSTGSQTEQKLLSWMEGRGAQFPHVEVALVNGVRGLIAKRDIHAGEIIASIPQDLAYFMEEAPKTGDDDGWHFHHMAAQVAQDMLNASSSLRPYWDSLPPRTPQPFTVYSFPPEYLPLLQAPEQEAYAISLQEGTQQYFEHYGGTSERLKGLTLEDLVYTLSMISSRYFGAEGGSRLVPLLDLANHINGCPHHHNTGACPQDGSRQCIIWKAAVDIPKGGELCNSYGGMWNDRSLMQYGFVSQSKQPGLYGVDRHDFDQVNIWGNNLFTQPLPAFSADSVTGWRKEAQRLRHRLRQLQAGDADAAKATAVASDGGGQLLDTIRQWRELRKDALTAEIERIKGEIQKEDEMVLDEEEYPDGLEVAASLSSGQEDDYHDEEEKDEL